MDLTFANSTCPDVNECNEKTDECAEHATCVNLPGSYKCKCDKGFQGDGISCTGKYHIISNKLIYKYITVNIIGYIIYYISICM